jgi:tRNA modification GTPase
MDLSQAEAVADLISAKTAMAHKLAMQQLRGGYKLTIKKLRECLVKILSLMELELDFSEEDVEFADRSELGMLLNISIRELNQLVNSFKAGNSFKNGIPVAIIGKPNSGKSTLLNRILNEERSIVSSVSGTTRDTIEESMQIDGLEFRFIDTAGIRQTKNNIETKGIERSYKAVERAEIVLYVCDITKTDTLTAQKDLLALDKHVSLTDKKIFVLANKIDLVELTNSDKKEWDKLKAIQLSASTGLGIGELLQKIVLSSGKDEYESNVLVTNVRHYEIMMKTLAALLVAKESLEAGQPTDIIVADIREAIHYIGEITGAVTTDEILNNIFSKFCIGK